MEIYTDGAASNNGKNGAIGGWAYVFVTQGDVEITGYGAESNTTNNKMELTAIIKAVEKFLEIGNCFSCQIYTDSAYCVNCYEQKWYEKWEKNGWINSKKEPVKNRELWEQLIPYFKSGRVQLLKVKGHSTNLFNQKADRLAVQAREQFAAGHKISNSKKVFIINGLPRAGKDTFVSKVRKALENKNSNPINLEVRNLSTVDKVKAAAKLLGWHGGKDLEARKFLSDLKDLSTKVYNGPFKYIVEQVESTKDGIYFVHCREPQEIEKLVKFLTNDGIETKTLFINNDSLETTCLSNHADREVFDYNYDIRVDNSGTLEDLKNKAKDFLNKYILN